jgi:hypothetical protein
MTYIAGWMRIGLVAGTVVALAGCSSGAVGAGDEVEVEGVEPAREQPASAPARGPSPQEWEAMLARVQARVDSTDRVLLRVRPLTGTEQAALRRDANATQIARARQLGIRRGADFEQEVAAGRLVPLADSTRYWVVRELDYSVPYVTPATEAMLAEIGERFRARLDSIGLPPFRIEITSVLRTPEKQAALRRSNPNAAQGVSAHEFGTTVDVAYRRFGPPVGGLRDLATEQPLATHPEVVQHHDSLMVELAALRGAEMQAVLGRVLHEMRSEGKLLVMMERRQTVYHMTVARNLPSRGPVPVE